MPRLDHTPGAGEEPEEEVAETKMVAAVLAAEMGMKAEVQADLAGWLAGVGEEAGCQPPDVCRPRCKTVVRHLETIGYTSDNVSSALLVDDKRAFRGTDGKGKGKSSRQNQAPITAMCERAG